MTKDEGLLRDSYDVLQAHAEPNHNVERVKKRIADRLGDGVGAVGADDPCYLDALQFVLSTGHTSMVALLREFWIGYRRIALIQQALVDAAVILPFGAGLNPDYKPNLKVVNE